MRKIFILIVLIVFSQRGLTQPAIQWQKCFGGTLSDYANSIQKTADEGYIMAGATLSNDGDVTGNHGNADYWIVKIDSSQNIQWQKSLGGTDNDWAHSICPSFDGGYIVAGESLSNDGDVTGNHGGRDFWIVKLDSAGNLQWQHCYGGTNNESAISISQTTDSGYIVSGSTSSTDGDVTGHHGLYYDDYWILKINSEGNIQWQKCLGGTNHDDATEIVQTAEGGYIVTGISRSNDGDITNHHGSTNYYDIWVVKLTATGIIQWQKSYGCLLDDVGRSIQQTISGGYILAGNVDASSGDVLSPFHGGHDYWVVEIDSTGNILWEKCLGGSSWEYGYSVRQASNGGYLVAGSSASADGDITGSYGGLDYWIVKLDTAGMIQWRKSLGGTTTDEAYSIIQANDGGWVITGGALSSNNNVSGNHGSTDVWTVKLYSESAPTGSVNIHSGESNILLSPNPATSEVRIQNSELKIEEIKIFDVYGQSVFLQLQTTDHKPQTTIDVSSLPNGIYFVRLKSGDKTFSQKIIISR